MNTKISRILTIALPASLVILLSGCLKTHDGFTDFSKTSDFVILAGSGLANLKTANFALASDTIRKTVTVDLASKDNSNGAVTVTIAVDPAALTAYNTANGTQFAAMPSGAYKLGSTKVTIPAGQHYGTTTLEIYRSKLDATKDYMLPISITDGGGKQLSSNQNTIYYNSIGNPIGGNYNAYLSRWKGTDSTGGAGTSFSYYKLDYGPVLFSPVNHTEVTTDGAFGDQLIIDFKNTGGVLSNFSASFPSGTAANLGVTSWGPPTVYVADPVNGYYRIGFTYVNSAGSRYVIYEFVRQ
jgi:hypothetical protein